MTYSVKKGTLIRGDEFWLCLRKTPPNYMWTYFENRTRFPDQETADNAARRVLGDDSNYGIFPNSKVRTSK